MTAQEKINKLKSMGLWYKWAKYALKNVRFLRNKKEFAVNLLHKDCDFREFISSSFPWDFTREGCKFWNEISFK